MISILTGSCSSDVGERSLETVRCEFRSLKLVLKEFIPCLFVCPSKIVGSICCLILLSAFDSGVEEHPGDSELESDSIDGNDSPWKNFRKNMTPKRLTVV